MAAHYEASFYALSLQISSYSPSAIPLLEQIKLECGAQSGYYAAFVLIYLKAKEDKGFPLGADSLTRQALQGFTFFEVAKNHPAALALFDEVLLCYQQDQADKTQPFQRPPRTAGSASSASDTVSAAS